MKNVDFDELRDVLLQYQEDEEGEIIEDNEEGIKYYDYEYSSSSDLVCYRRPSSCTKEKLADLVFVGRNVDKRITPEYVAQLLADAYGDELPNMMCALKAIAICNGLSDLAAFAQSIGATEEELYFDGVAEACELLGRTWCRKQAAIVYMDEILEGVDELLDEDEGITEDEAVADGLGVTLIHECRHVMFDCNPFLGEKEGYSPSDSEEDAVEEFSRHTWDMVRHQHKRF